MSEVSLSIERQEKESVAQYLTRMKEMGFLFHGSTKNQLEKLEPRYTHDPLEKENTGTAVFATDNPTLATIFGINGGNKNWSTHATKEGVIALIPETEREKLEHSEGSVYILSRNSFKEAGFQQFKSHEPVIPIDDVRATLEDYYDLEGKVEWTG